MLLKTFVYHWMENIGGKGENANYHYNVFKEHSFFRGVKVVFVVYSVKGRKCKQQKNYLCKWMIPQLTRSPPILRLYFETMGQKILSFIS